MSFFLNPFRFTGVTYPIDSADFDGTNDNLARAAALTGAASSKKGIFSAWVRLDGANADTRQIIQANGGGLGIRFLTTNAFRITIFSVPSPSYFTALEIGTAATFTSSSTWRHLLASWDLSVPGAVHLYVNDVSDLTVNAAIDANLNYTTTNWFVGGTDVYFGWMHGAMADVYFAPGQYLDFSDAANRRKFISTSGKPVDLGATGSTPTGTAPLIHHHLADAEAVANFATNRGTGGTFTLTGTLDTGSTSPSD